MFIPPIYGEIGDGLLLFYQQCTQQSTETMVNQEIYCPVCVRSLSLATKELNIGKVEGTKNEKVPSGKLT